MGKREKRKYPRFKETRYAAITEYRGTKIINDQIFSVLVDLSLGGCRVRCPSEIEIGSKVKIDIAFEEEIVSFKAKVKHCSPSLYGGWDIGVEFYTLKPETKTFLKKLLLGCIPKHQPKST